MKEAFEQRHFNRRTQKWSEWYASTRAAFDEHMAGPVRPYQVRQVPPPPEVSFDSPERIATLRLVPSASPLPRSA